MSKRNQGSNGGRRGGDAPGAAGIEPERVRVHRETWRIGWLACGALAVAALVSSCGSSGSGSGRSAAQTEPVALEPALNTVASTQAAPVPAAPRAALIAKPTRGDAGLSPDIAYSVIDTLVTAGEVVEFTVEATGDVSVVTLADGINSPEAFVHDPASGLWRVNYRVPMNPRAERLGLSITARTPAERWRRVWVFLHVDANHSEPTTPADSTHGGT